jgi:hypothetical protein
LAARISGMCRSIVRDRREFSTSRRPDCLGKESGLTDPRPPDGRESRTADAETRWTRGSGAASPHLIVARTAREAFAPYFRQDAAGRFLFQRLSSSASLAATVPPMPLTRKNSVDPVN